MTKENKEWLESIRKKYTVQCEINSSGYKARLIIMVKGFPKAIIRSSDLDLDTAIEILKNAYEMLSEEEVEENNFSRL